MPGHRRSQPIQLPSPPQAAARAFTAALALSVRQPAAELIVSGRKLVEYRSRKTHVRGLIYIYASLGRFDAATEGACSAEFGIDVGNLPRGVIVGTVDLYDCAPDDDLWQWYLREPQRSEVLRKPVRRPNPVWFRPW